MNKVYILFVVMIFALLFTQIFSSTEKFVIGAHRADCGFFSLFLGVLNNLAWCEKVKKVPVVYWGDRSLYQMPHSPCPNNWECFFEPVSQLVYVPGDHIYARYMARDRSLVPWMGSSYQQNFDPSYRLAMYAVIKKFIKIKSHIMKKVDDFYYAHMADIQIIGVHIRRSDKSAEALEVDLEEFITAMEAFPNYQYLVASDVTSVIKELQQRFGNKIIAYDAYRSDSNVPVHLQSNQDKIRLGEDVLIEALLLSRCDFFIHGCSNVATAVLFFNPNLQNEYLRVGARRLKKSWLS